MRQTGAGNRLRKHFQRMLVCCVAAALVARGGQVLGAPVSYPLALNRCTFTGAALSDKGAVPTRVFVQKDGQPIAAEAEQASVIEPPAHRITDAAASGGVALVVPEGAGDGTGAAEFSVQVTRAGTYTLFARVFWPNVGSNSLFGSVDGGEPAVFGNSEGPHEIGAWHWVKGRQYQLAADIHRLRLGWREDGSVLDAVALMPDGTTPYANEPSMLEPVYTGKAIIETPDFRPPGLRAWQRVTVLPDSAAAATAIAASVDGGTHWTRVSSSGDIGALNTHSGPLRLRLVMDSASLRGQVITAVQVEYDGSSPFLTLTTPAARLTFDRIAGAIIELTDTRTGEPMVRRDRAKPLLGLEERLPGQPAFRAISLDGTCITNVRLIGRPGNQSLIIEYRYQSPSGPIVAAVNLTPQPNGSLIAATVRVTNHSEATSLVGVDCPVLGGVRIGSDGNDDSLVFPRWAGQIVPDPYHNGGYEGRTGGGTGTMGWIDLFQTGAKPCGLYLADYDKTSLVTDMAALPEQGSTLTCKFTKYAGIGPGTTWTSQPMVFAVHAGDWHWAADQYREWWRSWAAPARTPEWLRESDGWLRTDIRSNFQTDLAAAWRNTRWLGLNHLQVWGQMTQGPAVARSCCNRFYFPDPRYGSETEFTAAVHAIRAAGGHIGFYTNGQAWNPRYPQLNPVVAGKIPPDIPVPNWEAGFQQNALEQADGSLVPQYAKPKDDTSPYPCAFYLMCPGSTGWPAYLQYWILNKYVRQYGVDFMYVDQVGAAPAQLCFNPSHHHRGPGEWAQGHLADFRELKTKGQQYTHAFALATEGYSNIYSPYVDTFLISPSSIGRWKYSHPEVVHYTFPDQLRRVCEWHGRRHAFAERGNEPGLPAWEQVRPGMVR